MQHSISSSPNIGTSHNLSGLCHRSSEMDVMDRWVAEFVLRRQRNPRIFPANLLSALKLEDCDESVKLKKFSVLRDISMCLARGKLDEGMLDLLETLELLRLEEHSLLLDSHKSAYCWMAVECTLNSMWKVPELDSLFPDALERIWTERIGVLKEQESELVTDELLKWEIDLRKALKEPELYQRILETNTRYIAVTYLNQLIKEKWALVGCSTLESVAQKWFTKRKAESVRGPNANLGGSDAVDENIDESEQEEEEEEEEEEEQEQEQEEEQEQEQEPEQEQEHEQEHESSVYKDDKMAAQELKDCLWEEVKSIIGSSNEKGPSNAKDHVFDVTPHPIPGGGHESHDHNKALGNVLDDSQGTSSGRVRPYLPTPVPPSVSPSKKSNLAKPHFRRQKKFWTPEVVEALKEGVREYGKSWKDIKNSKPLIFADRTEVDLKDKWRNLLAG